VLRGAARSGAKRVRVHILLDGRDVPDGSSVADTAELESVLSELRALGCDARVGSGGGRMHITMDRYEADWAMVQRGWAAHVLGEAEHQFAECALRLLRAARARAHAPQPGRGGHGAAQGVCSPAAAARRCSPAAPDRSSPTTSTCPAS